MKKAIVFGASGFIGSHLLNELLQSSAYSHVTAIVRRPLTSSAHAMHPKLQTHIGDLQSLPSLKQHLAADDIFIALGTTKKSTPQREAYYRVDHDYPVLAAKLTKEMGAKAVFVVTAVGAKANAPFFYIRTKGEVERDIEAVGFTYTHIFQPSMILGNRQEHRPMEKVLMKVWQAFDPIFLGKLDCYKGIDGKQVAQAMVHAASKQDARLTTYRWREMMALLKEGGIG